MRSLRSRAPAMYDSARSTSRILKSMRITCSFAPPWSGPERAPMAEVIAAYILARVPAVTHAANVEELHLGSAFTVKISYHIPALDASLLPSDHMKHKVVA